MLSRYEQVKQQLDAEDAKTKQWSDKLKAKSREIDLLRNNNEMDPAKREALNIQLQIPGKRQELYQAQIDIQKLEDRIIEKKRELTAAVSNTVEKKKTHSLQQDVRREVQQQHTG